MGQIDIPLNDIGLAQANIIANKLSSLRIFHIFSGPLKKTIQTSEVISQATNAPITIIREFKMRMPVSWKAKTEVMKNDLKIGEREAKLKTLNFGLNLYHTLKLALKKHLHKSKRTNPF